MLSQNDVSQFSQNTMPRGRSRSRSVSRAKRSRYSSRSASSLTMPRNQLTNQGRTWPYQNRLSYAKMWDPFPAKAMARLRYSTVVSLVISQGGTPASHLFRCNSIFDPDYTGVGHQPYGHDTYQTIYNHYNVKRATITMTPTTSGNMLYGIAKTDDTTVSADYDQVREQKGCNVAAGQGSSIIPSVTNYYTDSYFHNVNAITSAQFGANPNDQMFFQCFLEAADSTATLTTRTFIVNITYDVEMWELKDLGKS